ncbi:MAG: class I SAM-dependent methyltransferase [bacterium]|nr:class I SAM-dependent methyltransferase [bacterium]
MDGKQKNADRFTGFADIYENARPMVPQYPINVICSYLGKKPDTVVDLGCGTGLSSRAWKNTAGNIIGIEPSIDMINIARCKQSENMKFIQAFSDKTTLPDNCADVVVCSQSFHWMEPKATLKEVNRILKGNGVFAAVDCDWPPVTLRQAEKAYMTLYSKVKEIEKSSKFIKDTFVHYSKDKHLKNINDSGYFTYTREILFANTEKCTAERFINIILSQGSLQTILKNSPELIEADTEQFKTYINNLFGKQEFDIDFCYRMRIGIK